MAKKEWTEEERQKYRDMANARVAAAKAKREAAASDPPREAPEPEPEPEPIREPEPDEAEYFPPPVVAMGGEPAAPAEPEIEIEPVPETEFDRFLVALDRETRDLLDDEELAEIFEQQKAKARAERKTAAKKAVADRALLHARIDEGLVPAATAADLAWKARMEEQVRFTVDLPDMGDIGLRIDQRIFLHGHTYTVSRAVYESMRSTMYQAQQAELLFEGKDKRHWLRRRARGSVNGHVDMGMAA